MEHTSPVIITLFDSFIGWGILIWLASVGASTSTIAAATGCITACTPTLAVPPFPWTAGIIIVRKCNGLINLSYWNQCSQYANMCFRFICYLNWTSKCFLSCWINISFLWFTRNPNKRLEFQLVFNISITTILRALKAELRQAFYACVYSQPR